MKIIVMGPPGSGKSTQARLLAQSLNLPHISTGDLLREIEEGKSELARRVRAQLEEGRFASDRDMTLLLKEELKKDKYRGGFILDGYPRNPWQAENTPFPIDRVFYLEVSDEESKRRLLARGRRDDIEELIIKRLSDYHNLTEPILGFYREKGVLEEVDGERSIEQIFADILLRIEK